MSHGTLYIDPSYNSSKFRSEFRIPESNGVYKNDMRLLNIGLKKTNIGNTSYNMLCGAYGIIDSIQLYSGSQLLDQLQVFSNYVALKNLLNSNNENQSIKRPLSRNKLGYVANGLDDIDVSTGAVTFGVKQTNNVPDRFNTVYGSDASSQLQATNGSWLDLRECMGFLRGTPYVPMNVYPDFRVVVNYKNSNLLNIVKDTSATLETLEPLLVCEYETNPEIADSLMRTYQGHTFDCVEHDQVQLVASTPAQNTIVEQQQTYLIKGFNDKYISRVALVNTPTVSATWMSMTDNYPVANQGSVSQLDWSYQVRMNGSNMFATTLYKGKMRRLGQMSDAWGSMNVAFGQNICETAGGGSKIFNAVIQNTVGAVDYTGFKIDDVVKEFKLTVQRDAVGPDATPANNQILRQPLNLNLYGISRKRCVPTSQGILVQYV